jgi:hypothetical protein
MRTHHILLFLIFTPGISGLYGDEIRSVKSPDKVYEAISQDSKDVRIITVRNRQTNKILFQKTTNARYTIFAWTKSSSFAAIVNAPDNANTYLWIVSTASERVREVDLFKSVRKLVQSTSQMARGGVMHLHWLNNFKLECIVVFQNQYFNVAIDCRRSSQKLFVIKVAPPSSSGDD